MKNKLSVPMLLSAIVLIGVYFIWQNSKQNSMQTQKDLVELQNNCQNWGNAILKNNRFYNNPQVSTHYNTTFGKCYVDVMSATYSSGGNYVLNDIIFDGEKGTSILDEFTGGGPNTSLVQNVMDSRPATNSGGTITVEQFDKLKDQYMNN